MTPVHKVTAYLLGFPSALLPSGILNKVTNVDSMKNLDIYCWKVTTLHFSKTHKY